MHIDAHLLTGFPAAGHILGRRIAMLSVPMTQGGAPGVISDL